MSFGIPNGHANTQFEHAMQRGLSADWTMPSSFCLIASAGQTSAHVGSSQCMHTIGTVCVGRAPVDEVEVHHRMATMGSAFFACVHAGFAADATARVDDVDAVAELAGGIHQCSPVERS